MVPLLLLLLRWLLALTAGSSSAPATAPSYTLAVDALTSVAGKDFRLAITRTPRFIRLRFARRDSIRLQQCRRDFPAVFQLAPPLADPLAEQQRLQLLRQVLERYSVFTRDSLLLPVRNHRPFVELLDSVYGASDVVLAQAEANRLRVGLDGTRVTLTRTAAPAATAARSLSVWQPAARTHPLLYRFLHESLALYRRERPTTFLTRDATSGY